MDTDKMSEDYNKALENIKDVFEGSDFLNNMTFSDDTRISPIPYKITIGVVNKSNNDLPKYESDEASGFDIRAFIDTPIVLNSLERAIIPTGLFFDIPSGFEMQIRPRSGMAANHGITVLNTPGTIDSDYTGEIKIILVNLSKDKFTIESGERIAQGILNTVFKKTLIDFELIESINKNTERGSGGFGSTGTK